MKFQRPKGTKDILPQDIGKWHYVEKTIRNVMVCYYFDEIRTPTFESTELFTRGVGADTDIVGKEMYTFDDKGGNSLTLKPEMTAPVVRAYLENSLYAESQLQKLYYISSIFRYERPQEGRYREHTQFGAEIIGSDDTATDIELILLAKEVYNKCGVTDVKVKINSIGQLEERKKYILKLKEYLGKSFDDLSEDSKRRYHNNPLRILDSKEGKDIEIISGAPQIVDHLSHESRLRFDKVINSLTKLGVDLDIDFRLVRGLDYYTDTTFEFISRDLGAQDAIGGGGRYDGLVETIGGKPTPGIGFAIGLERVILAAERNNFQFEDNRKLKIYIITLTEEAKEVAMKLSMELRNRGISCENDFLNRSLKAQMREANKLNAEWVYIVGEEEIQKGIGVLKKMSDGSQNGVPFDKILEYVKQ
ncbi:MAG: histidine--tRNA ligase [Ignavibacteria bacterium]|jgi:histidyl-tRNA synthetase